MSRIMNVETISQIHEGLGYEKPKHPLISLIDNSKINPALFHEEVQVITGFYSINFKEGCECKVAPMGRNICSTGRQPWDPKGKPTPPPLRSAADGGGTERGLISFSSHKAVGRCEKPKKL